MINKSFYSILLLSSFMMMLSCGDYSRVVKGDDYNRKLQKAEELYDNESYNKALVLYEQVYQRHPRDDKGELAYYKLGKTYYKMKDFYMSSYYFSHFVGRFPRSKHVEESTFYSAMSSFHNSPDPALDQEDTHTAIRELQYFISNFPNSRRVDSCNILMDELRAKLETKALMAVKMYDRMEKYAAAVTSSESFLEDYPRSSSKLEVVMIMLTNASKLAEKSVFSKRQERLENVVAIYDKYREELQLSKHLSKAITIAENARQDLEEVDEIVTFERIQELYSLSQQSSKAKKIEYLEETLKLYYTFAQRYPNSDYLKRAEEIYNRAERERQNTYSY